MTSATEVLRRLLDERGVEWDRGKLAMLDDEYTQWWVSDRMEGFVAYECDYPLNTLIVRGIAPEQAIAATLGDADATGERQGDAGTCHDEGDPSDFCCSECGVRMFTETSDTYTMIASDGRTIIKHPNYCPNCGRRCVG